jgi:Rps23 Pro-64 3,4-dihydroxylase Tpa1-like proline 4-hydroxylase
MDQGPTKRQKTAEAVLQPLGDDQIKAKQSEYATATPYPHVVLRPAIDDATLKSARREAIHELRADYKETDLFKVYQVPHDLGTIERTAPHLADKAPSLLRVRDALYSESTRRLVERITGCGSIGDTVDCSANVYMRGGHLLCHDDVIGNRLVSFVLYLVDEDWSESDGGAFELFPVVDGEPSPIPCHKVDCKWNSLLLFKVEPGKSHHAVAEVLGEKPRLTISGWYHAREQRDGAAARASSLGQLRVSAPRTFKSFDGDDDEDDVDRSLSSEDLSALGTWVAPAYLDPEAWPRLREHFANDSAARLVDFCCDEIASAVAKAEREGPHDTWRVVGPPHKRRYCIPEGETDLGRALAKVETGASSAAFRRLLARITGVRPVARDSTIRRFRPGRDYTVAVSGDPVPVVDATFCFLGSSDPCEHQNFMARSRRVDLHAIDAALARWRGDAGSSPLDGVHPTHWLISTQVVTTRRGPRAKLEASRRTSRPRTRATPTRRSTRARVERAARRAVIYCRSRRSTTVCRSCCGTPARCAS